MDETHVTQGLAAAAPTPEAAAGPSNWSGGRIAALAVGVLLALAAVVVLGAGGVGLWADLSQREAGYVTTGTHDFSTSGSALVTERTHLGAAGIGWLYSPSLLGTVRIRVTPADGGPLFVGVGPSRDVERYLAGVSHTRISEFFEDKVETVAGGPPRSAPARQPFWVASSTGPGTRTLLWKPSGGSWSVVVMNADARPGLGIKADLGARLPAVRWIAVGLLVAGAVLLAGGGLLIAAAIRGRRAGTTTERRNDAER